MTIPPLSERRKKLAETRDRDGNPIDNRALAKNKFLTDPNATAGTLAKSAMGSDAEPEDRRAYLRERNRIIGQFVKKALQEMDFPLQKYAKRNDRLGEVTRELQRQIDLLENGPQTK